MAFVLLRAKRQEVFSAINLQGGFMINGYLKLGLCLMITLIVASCGTTSGHPSRDLAGGEVQSEAFVDSATNKENSVRPAFTKKRFIKNETY